jgi:hypothetical protein
MRKNLIVPTMLIIALLATGVFTPQAVFAQEDPAYRPLIQRLADEFGLREEEVEQVIDEVRQERQEHLYQQWIDRLNTAVVLGKLTQEQMDALVSKQKDVIRQMNELQEMTPQDRHEALNAIQKEFEQWADNHHINLKFTQL